MRSSIIAVGRAKAGPERALFEHYQARVQAPFSLQLIEVEEKRALQGHQLREREATLLQGCIPDGAIVIALDEKEKSSSSKDFARKIGNWRDRGIRDLVFMIGVQMVWMRLSVSRRVKPCLLGRKLGRICWSGGCLPNNYIELNASLGATLIIGNNNA